MADEISDTGAIAVITPESGLLTSKSSWPSDQLVLMDKESFPTGMAIPS